MAFGTSTMQKACYVAASIAPTFTSSRSGGRPPHFNSNIDKTISKIYAVNARPLNFLVLKLGSIFETLSPFPAEKRDFYSRNLLVFSCQNVNKKL